VQRGGGARSFHIDNTTVSQVHNVVRDTVARETRLMTDEARHYDDVGQRFASHESVKHQCGRICCGDVHTNTVEGFYSIFKRGMKGTYQHRKEKHLHRYLAEFDFRYSNRVRLGVDDVERTARAVKGIVGKRLTYATPRH
jgi:hypothetical protein